MKKLLVIVLMLFAHVCVAQVNLVPNPSFEDTVSCPFTAGQVDRAVGWYPSRNTPDYFNQCDWINGLTSVPKNFTGYQYAHSGVAYCGFCPYTRVGPNYRENFTCNLLVPLTIGTKYYISFYISHADLNYNLSCNKLGVLLSTVNYNAANNSPTDNYAQFYTDSIITDTLNWVLISGSIIADSAYSYLSIGNFFVDSLTDTIYHPPTYAAIYYYIDDISLIADTATSLEELYTENKLSVYPNPFQDKIKINSINKEVTNAQLFNIEGRLIKEFYVFGKTENELNLKEFSNGLYILKLDYKKGNSTYHKLLKQ